MTEPGGPTEGFKPMPALILFCAATSIGGAWQIGYFWLGWPLWTLFVLAALMVPAVPVFMAVRRRVKIAYWRAKGRRALAARLTASGAAPSDQHARGKMLPTTGRPRRRRARLPRA